MPLFSEMTAGQRAVRAAELRTIYDGYKARGLRLDMSRGKPGADQLTLSHAMLNLLSGDDLTINPGGIQAGNYGVPEGLVAARELFGGILGVPAAQVIVGGNSSLNLMYDQILTAYTFGWRGEKPWSQQEGVKFLCPVPGYDRHFAITERLGIKMIPVSMGADGPDMDAVEALVRDPQVKGIWCVPMYANPTGVTYSDEVVRRLAALPAAAADFMIMWDNAYCMLPLTQQADTLLNLYEAAEQAGREDQVVMFTSTSKLTFPGAGVAAVASSPRNIKEIAGRLAVQTIGYDKLNMLRHVKLFGNVAGVRVQAEKHAAILRPKFELVLEMLENAFGVGAAGEGLVSWYKPRGGYFVSVDLAADGRGLAKRTVQLLKEAGVVMTPAGATYPYGNDPVDCNLRIAPTFPPLEELRVAMELFCVCVELAAME